MDRRRRGDGHELRARSVPYFYGDVPPAVARGLAARLKPQTLPSFTDAQTRAAWQDLPSTYILCEQDGAIPPAVQEVMAACAGTAHRLDSSHSPCVSQPAALAALNAGAAGCGADPAPGGG